MKCRELIEQLGDYLNGGLSAERVGALETHLEGCATCRSYVEAYREGVKAVRESFAQPDPPLPEELVRAILDARRKDGAG